MMLGECRCNVPIHFHYYNVVRQQNIISTTTQSRILLSFLAICNYEGSLIMYIFGNKFETPNVHFVGVHIFFQCACFQCKSSKCYKYFTTTALGENTICLSSIFHIDCILIAYVHTLCT